MDILSNIQDFIANPSQPITQEWLDEVQQQYPYFNLPALLYLKQHGIEGNEELLGKLAISCADRKVLSTHLGDGADLFRDFYPQEKEEPTTTTTHAIDMFLDAFGSGSQKEVEVLENMIFNPTPDYADILAAEDQAAPATAKGESAQDALINSFIAQEREKEKKCPTFRSTTSTSMMWRRLPTRLSSNLWSATIQCSARVWRKCTSKDVIILRLLKLLRT